VKDGFWHRVWPEDYRPDFPAFVKWIWVGILVVPVLIALLLQVTG
jgi:hypothetical protein